MSAPDANVDVTDRFARIMLSWTIEPGDFRVTGLVSELGDARDLDHQPPPAAHGSVRLQLGEARSDQTTGFTSRPRPGAHVGWWRCGAAWTARDADRFLAWSRRIHHLPPTGTLSG